MLRAEKYLENYYKQYPSDCHSKFLQTFGCYMYFNTIYNEIKKYKINDNIDFFNFIVDEYYQKAVKNYFTYTRSEIVNGIFQTNLKQYNKLKDLDFIINIVTTNSPKNERLKGIYNFEKEEFIVSKNKDITKRKFILYFKTGDSNHTNFNDSTKVGVDIFQLCVIYKVLKKLIDDRFIKNFNDVLIIPKFKNHIPEFIKKDLGYNVEWKSHVDYLNECCLYSNPFHFYGGTIESAFAKTKPIICSTIAIQKPYVKHFEDYFYMPFYYHKGKVFDKEIKVDGYDGDKELQMRYGEKGFNYCERMMKKAKNNSLKSLITTLVDRIVFLDKTL